MEDGLSFISVFAQSAPVLVGGGCGTSCLVEEGGCGTSCLAGVRRERDQLKEAVASFESELLQVRVQRGRRDG